MTIPFFLLLIEKVGEAYRGYTPNILGISAKGTREEVEESLLSQVQEHLAELKHQHASGSIEIEVSVAPIEESSSCFGPMPGEADSSCKARAKKDGLCSQHWRQRYGHAVKSLDDDACELCGESRRKKIHDWQDRCACKARNLDWQTFLTEKRKIASALRAERASTRALRDALPKCTGTLANGEKCDKVATQNKLCGTHWQQIFGHRFTRKRSETFGNCTFCGVKEIDVIHGYKSTHCGERQPGESNTRRSRVPRVESPPPPQNGERCAGRIVQGKNKGDQCSNQAQKDGLCHAHWRKRFGHDPPNYLSEERGCATCGETDYEILSRWNMPCPKKSKPISRGVEVVPVKVETGI